MPGFSFLKATSIVSALGHAESPQTTRQRLRLPDDRRLISVTARTCTRAASIASSDQCPLGARQEDSDFTKETGRKYGNDTSCRSC